MRHPLLRFLFLLFLVLPMAAAVPRVVKPQFLSFTFEVFGKVQGVS
jgi:hypothetical protein